MLTRSLSGLVCVVVVVACAAVAAANTDALPADAEGMLRLRILDPDGNPAANVPVGNYAERKEQTGFRVVFNTDQGPQALTTDAEGWAHVWPGDSFWNRNQRAVVYAVDEARRLAALVRIDKAQAGDPLTITLEPACRVRGKLTSEALNALDRSLTWTNVYVEWNGARPLSWASSQQTFEFLLPPGQYRLDAYGTDTYSATPTLTIKPGRREMELTVDLPANRLAALIGQPAPELRQIKGWKNGKPVTLEALRGKVVLLDFWGYWCGPCVQSMPQLMQMHDRYADKGLVIIGVHDDSAASIAEMDEKLAGVRQRLWEGRDIPFLIALDGGGRTTIPDTQRTAAGATTAAYGINAFPTYVLIGPDGTVLDKVNPGRQLDRRIEELLGLNESVAAPQLPGWERAFDEVYRLEPGQALKRVAPPFIPERMAYYRSHYADMAQRHSEPPDYFHFRWVRGHRVEEGYGFIRSTLSFRSVLSRVLKLPANRFDGPQDIMDLPLPSDWIVDTLRSDEQLLAALAEIVSQETGRTVRFVRRIVPREVVIAVGSFEHRPLPGADVRNVHLLIGDPKGQRLDGGGGGSVDELLKRLESQIRQPVINMVEYPAELDLRWQTYPSGRIWELPEGPPRQAALEELLERVSVQTSLRFSRETRDVAIWMIETGADASR